MKTDKTQTPRIVDLARELEADIRRKNLKQGDGYLTLTQAAKMLKVNAATANRALQLLAQRKVLVRRKGSVIGSLDGEARVSTLRRVFMFVHRGFLRQEGVAADAVMAGIQSELPEAEVQFNFLPETDPTEYVNGLISTILRGREPAGVVMTKAPFVVQRLVEDSGLPAVVNGSLYPSIRRLSSVEQDNGQIAQLMAGYAIEQKCTHVCALTREVLFPGDNVVLRNLARLFGAAGLKAGAFEIAHLPDDLGAMEAEIASLLVRHPTGLGLLCRSEIKAEAAIAAIAKLGLKPKQSPAIIVSGLTTRPENLNIPAIVSSYSPDEVGAAIGRLLASQVLHPGLGPESIMIPVELASGA